MTNEYTICFYMSNYHYYSNEFVATNKKNCKSDFCLQIDNSEMKATNKQRNDVTNRMFVNYNVNLRA